MTTANHTTTGASDDLAIVARELDRIIERLTDAAAVARGLSAATDWQAKAAVLFHETAARWAGEVSGLGCLAETARLDAARARDRAALLEAAAGAHSSAPWSAR